MKAQFALSSAAGWPWPNLFIFPCPRFPVCEMGQWQWSLEKYWELLLMLPSATENISNFRPLGNFCAWLPDLISIILSISCLATKICANPSATRNILSTVVLSHWDFLQQLCKRECRNYSLHIPLLCLTKKSFTGARRWKDWETLMGKKQQRQEWGLVNQHHTVLMALPLHCWQWQGQVPAWYQPAGKAEENASAHTWNTYLICFSTFFLQKQVLGTALVTNFTTQLTSNLVLHLISAPGCLILTQKLKSCSACLCNSSPAAKIWQQRSSQFTKL